METKQKQYVGVEQRAEEFVNRWLQTSYGLPGKARRLGIALVHVLNTAYNDGYNDGWNDHEVEDHERN